MHENIADPDLSPDIKWMEENPFSKIPPVWFSLLPPIMKTKQEGQWACRQYVSIILGIWKLNKKTVTLFLSPERTWSSRQWAAVKANLFPIWMKSMSEVKSLNLPRQHYTCCLCSQHWNLHPEEEHRSKGRHFPGQGFSKILTRGKTFIQPQFALHWRSYPSPGQSHNDSPGRSQETRWETESPPALRCSSIEALAQPRPTHFLLHWRRIFLRWNSCLNFFRQKHRSGHPIGL